MAQIFRIDENGGGEELLRVYCDNEDKELQSMLGHNFDLLPGDQMSPDDPCRWFLIRREMPVPDPTSGSYRWNIDFLFSDQRGIPTFVECKRFNDTDSRRKVVGQMMEYAANGQHYWSATELAAFAHQSASARGFTVPEELKRIGWVNADEPDSYFHTIEENLREGQVRLVFFLEEAPYELKSIVEFLNSQMERSEVLLVEARQYQLEAQRLISPMLFGYTEEARMVKRKVSVESSGRQHWGVDSFFDQALQILQPDQVQTIRRLFDSCKKLDCEVTWGSGKQSATFSVKWPQISSQNLFNIRSDGRMEVPLGAMNKNQKDESTRDELKSILSESLGLPVPVDYFKRFPGYRLEQWQDGADLLAEKIGQLLENGHQS